MTFTVKSLCNVLYNYHIIEDRPSHLALYVLCLLFITGSRDLGNKNSAFAALSAFWNRWLTGGSYPRGLLENTEENGRVRLNISVSDESFDNITICQADSDDKYFREAEWTNQPLKIINKSEIETTITLPDIGYRTFYVI